MYFEQPPVMALIYHAGISIPLITFFDQTPADFATNSNPISNSS